MRILRNFVHKVILDLYALYLMKRIIQFLLIAVFFGSIGYIIGAKVPIQLFDSIDKNATVSTWEAFYYIISFLGVICTFLAVIVALWKEEILSRWHKAKLKVEIKGLDFSSNSKYYGLITVSNSGKYLASNCRIFIKSLRYGKYEDEIENIPLRGNLAVNWTGDTYRNLVPGGQQSVTLFCVKQSGDDMTPLENIGKPVIDFWGISSLSADQRSNGCWIIDYCISYNNDTLLEHFSIKIQWNGQWKSKKREMEKILKFRKY